MVGPSDDDRPAHENYNYRIVSVELRLQRLETDVHQLTTLVSELHQDMLERRAAICVTKLAAKWIAWAVIGVLTIVGVTKNPEALVWLKDIPK